MKVDKHDRVILTPVGLQVSVGGYIANGGFGYLSPALGLSVDNVLEIKVGEGGGAHAHSPSLTNRITVNNSYFSHEVQAYALQKRYDIEHLSSLSSNSCDYPRTRAIQLVHVAIQSDKLLYERLLKITPFQWMYIETLKVPLHVLSTQHNHNRRDMQKLLYERLWKITPLQWMYIETLKVTLHVYPYSTATTGVTYILITCSI